MFAASCEKSNHTIKVIFMSTTFVRCSKSVLSDSTFSYEFKLEFVIKNSTMVVVALNHN
jgi:hypothetical protein